MGNSGSAEYIPLLIKALDDSEPLVRGHAAWALARLSPHGQKGEIREVLTYHSQHENDEEAGTEFHLALKKIGESDS
jgi:epoxyqueuosine reductase